MTGVSIGIADTNDTGYSVEEIITYSDIAMYHSKHHHKGTATLFHHDMLVENKRNTIIVNSIVQAAKRSEFKLYYQPKVNVVGRVVGVEALIRWEHPELGALFPNEFIPIAETSGKISDITKWVISQVISDLPRLIQLKPDIKVSFNISTFDLKNDWLESYLQKLIRKIPELVKHMQIEVTETSYLNDYKEANNFFALVKEAGVTIALDDFGTGFSSLSYLSRIDIDTIKIDRDFVVNFLHDQRERAVLKAILELSYRLGLGSCCEGVETMEQAKFLIENGCDQMQGFYFSAAVPLEQLGYAFDQAARRYDEIDLF